MPTSVFPSAVTSLKWGKASDKTDGSIFTRKMSIWRRAVNVVLSIKGLQYILIKGLQYILCLFAALLVLRGLDGRRKSQSMSLQVATVESKYPKFASPSSHNPNWLDLLDATKLDPKDRLLISSQMHVAQQTSPQKGCKKVD